eukprot:SAG31_NODE_31_length_32474_cov_18.308139_5_plen_114_part_00
MKRDFMHLGCLPDNFCRGSTNPFRGKSPLYLVMGLQCMGEKNRIDTFEEIVRLIRGAVSKSRQLDHAEQTKSVLNGTAVHNQLPRHLSHAEHHPNASLIGKFLIDLLISLYLL